MYRCNDNQYEPVVTSVMRPGGKLYSNILKIPNEGVLNQNIIGQERNYHEFRGHLSQLSVYNLEKTDQDINIIEDILSSQSNFEYQLGQATLPIPDKNAKLVMD